MNISRLLSFHRYSQLLTLLLVSTISNVCQAGLILEIGDVTMTAGQTGSLNVFVRSTSSDPVNIYNYRLRITPIVEVGGSLSFADTPSQKIDFKDDASYIFNGDSLGLGATRQQDVKEIVGGDFASADVNISTTPRLLARVQLQHTTLTPLTSSGSYRVSLINDTNLTFFQDLNANDITIDPSSYSPANSGLVTVNIAAVPEPTSLLAATALISALAIRRRRRRV